MNRLLSPSRALVDALAGPEQAAEKVLISPGKPEKHTSGAEAHVDFMGFMPGINPRPTARMSFSAACEARQLIQTVAARLKSCPITKHNTALPEAGVWWMMDV